MNDTREKAEECFIKDVAAHEMTIKHSDRPVSASSFRVASQRMEHVVRFGDMAGIPDDLRRHGLLDIRQNAGHVYVLPLNGRTEDQRIVLG